MRSVEDTDQRVACCCVSILLPSPSTGSSMEAAHRIGTQLEEGNHLTRSRSLHLREAWPRPIRARATMYRVIQCSQSHAITVRISLVADAINQPPVPDGTTGRSIGAMLEAAGNHAGCRSVSGFSTSPYSHEKASQWYYSLSVKISWGFLLDAAEADRMHAGRSRVQR